MGQLLTRVTSTTAAEPKTWEVSALFYNTLGNLTQARECHLKHCRALQAKGGWDRKAAALDELADAAMHCAEAHCVPLGVGPAGDTSDKTQVYTFAMWCRSAHKKVAMDGAVGSTPSGEPGRTKLAKALAMVDERHAELSA